MRPPRGEGVFVVHCSSAAYMPHFQDFLRGRMGLPHYALLAVPGGVQSLTLAEYLPKFAWAGWRHIKFLSDLDAPSRVILIGHDDCRWYHRGPIPHAAAAIRERERQEADLRKVAASWKERFGSPEIDLYYANMQAGKPVFDAFH